MKARVRIAHPRALGRHQLRHRIFAAEKNRQNQKAQEDEKTKANALEALIAGDHPGHVCTKHEYETDRRKYSYKNVEMRPRRRNQMHVSLPRHSIEILPVRPSRANITSNSHPSTRLTNYRPNLIEILVAW